MSKDPARPIASGFSRTGGPGTSLPSRPADHQHPDTVTRRIHQLIDQPVYRSIMERYGLTRVPGSVWLDENGEVA